MKYQPYNVGDEVKWIGNQFGPFYGVIKSVKFRYFRSPVYMVEWHGENGNTTRHRHEHVLKVY